MDEARGGSHPGATVTTKTAYGLRDKSTGALARLQSAGDRWHYLYPGHLDMTLPVFEVDSYAKAAFVKATPTVRDFTTPESPCWSGNFLDIFEIVRIDTRVDIARAES